MKKFTKQLLTGVVALGMLAPVATSALNPVNTTVNAKRHYGRHGRKRVRHHGKRRVKLPYIRSEYSHSNRSIARRAWAYAKWFSRNGGHIYRRYRNRRSFMNGINDGLNGGTYNGGAILNMDSVHHSLYYKGWVIGNATSRSYRFIHHGLVYSSPRNYKNAIALYNQGRRYGDNSGNEYVKYYGHWSELPASDTSNVGTNSSVLATLHGNYRL